MDVSARGNLASDLASKYVRDGLVYQLENFDSKASQVIALPEDVWNLELITLECCFEETSDFVTKRGCIIGPNTATVYQIGSVIRNENGGGVFYRLSQYYSSAWKRMDNTKPFDKIATSISQSVNVNNPKVEYYTYEKGKHIATGQTATSAKLTGFKNMYLDQGIFYHSIRIYNRILSDKEVMQNWLIDERRLGN